MVHPRPLYTPPSLPSRLTWRQESRPRFWGGRCAAPFAALTIFCTSPQWSAAQTILHAGQFVPRDTIVLTDRSPTGTITIVNGPTPDTAQLLPDCPGGDYAPLNEFQHELIDERPQLDPLTAAWHNAGTCAAAWLSDYPRHVPFAANERRTITIRITPPATLPNGRYTARLIAIGAGGPGSASHTEVDVTYLRGPWPRLRWHPAPPDGPGSGMVTATPALVVFGDSARHGTFTLQNHAARPVELWLTLDCPWFLVNFAAFPWSSQYEQIWHERIPSLALWIGNVPQHLVLAPHERRTIPLDLISQGGEDATSGGYDKYARVVYTEAPVVMGTSGGDSLYTTPSGAVTLIYHTADSTGRRRIRPAFTLGPPFVQEQDFESDGDQRSLHFICDTIRPPDPGLGFLARLHVALTDAQGRPLPPTPQRERWWLGKVEIFRAKMDLASTPTLVLGDPAWTLDTVMAVRAVTLQSVLDKASVFGTQRKAPDPVCVALPGLPTGHYQVMLEASAVDDTAHRQPVRLAVPIEIP